MTEVTGLCFTSSGFTNEWLSRSMMPAFPPGMALRDFPVPWHCRAGTKLRKTVLPPYTGLHPVRGYRLSLRDCMAHLRKEAPDVVYLCSGHGRETADAYYKEETCTETSGYWQGTHRQPCPFYDTVLQDILVRNYRDLNKRIPVKGIGAAWTGLYWRTCPEDRGTVRIPPSFRQKCGW